MYVLEKFRRKALYLILKSAGLLWVLGNKLFKADKNLETEQMDMCDINSVFLFSWPTILRGSGESIAERLISKGESPL